MECHAWQQSHSAISKLSAVSKHILRSIVKNGFEQVKHVGLSKDHPPFESHELVIQNERTVPNMRNYII